MQARTAIYTALLFYAHTDAWLCFVFFVQLGRGAISQQQSAAHIHQPQAEPEIY
jgi:hypothetical protein